MSGTVEVSVRKQALREYAAARRVAAARAAGPGAGIRAANHFLAAVPVPLGSVVSGYAPVRDEFDVMPLLGRLARAGYGCCLPVVVSKKAMVFRAWQPGARLMAGPFSIPEPVETAPAVRPTHLLVPLLAYDARGYRLGYGGGYYDRALGDLRAAGPVIAIGVAYGAQCLEQVPHTDHDQPMDWIVTERGAMPIGKAA